MRRGGAEFKIGVLKLGQGAIIGFCKDSTEFNRLVEMIGKTKNHEIKNEEILSIIETVENNPIYLQIESREGEEKLDKTYLDRIYGDPS